MSEEACIWCEAIPACSLEHIAPDSLGCPPTFVLTKGVCAKCNAKNGRLDRALLAPFEIITVLKGIPRKKGKKPTVDGFSTVSSGYDENGPVFYMNREKFAVQIPTGKQLSGTNAADPIKNARWEYLPDGTVRMTYDQELRFDRKAVRGLFKIALESIAFFEGLEAARNPILSPIKHFVLNGGGNFRAIMMSDPSAEYENYFSPRSHRVGCSSVSGMTIMGIGFLCDFDPEFRGGKMLLAEANQQGVSAQVIPNWPRNLWIANNAKNLTDKPPAATPPTPR